MRTIKINPLNILNIREVDCVLPHFQYVTVISKTAAIKEIREWILLNLTHRYYIGESLIIDEFNQFIVTTKIGFEEPKELSFFLLSCSHLI